MTNEAASSPRKNYHHGDLRSALIQAADGLLQTSGNWTFTLREVARAAGVSHNAPYNHFADKRALLAAVATPGFIALGASLVDAVADPATGKRDKIIALAKAYVLFGVANPAMFRLMFSDELAKSDDHPDLVSATAAAFDVLRHTMLGDPGNDDDNSTRPETDALAAWALVHGLTVLVLDGRIPSADKPAALDFMVGQVARTLLDGTMGAGS